MEPCTFTSRMGAYHDGELDAQARRDADAHLAGCAQCRAELAHLREVSKMFGSVRLDGLTTAELTELRDRAEGLADRPSLHLFGGMMAAAASILIVCGAWWNQLPRTAPAAPRTYATHELPAWEKMAMGYPDSLPGHPPEATAMAVADAQLAEWMLAGL